jgi:16S rRNA (adenine1518-N6/adenine1519-N6)-dimethyltransferase
LTGPKKSLGQHFLSDPRILNRIADSLDPVPGETVLEIGPGLGGLTAPLVKRAGRLIAIERDSGLIGPLRERFPSVAIAEGDALDLDWHALVGPHPFSIIGNIPYNITSPLIDQALQPPRPRRIVFLMQKEVADRLAAPPGVPAYGALTVGVQTVAKVERLFTVAAGAFRPPPKVESAVVRLTPLLQPLIEDSEVAPFRRFVVGLFTMRRKQLGRALRSLLGVDAEMARSLAQEAGLTETVRMETVPPAVFVTLFRAGQRRG